MQKIKIDPRICILFSVIILLIPIQWALAWGVSVLFHELCHCFFVKILGGNILEFSVGLGGANIKCECLSDSAYLIAILSGPVGGLALVLLGSFFPRLAICSWLLSVYNLLPILPLDGGHAVRILVKKDKVFNIIERTALFSVSVVSLITCLLANIGPIPLIVSASLWLKKRKRPCKGALDGVQ